VDPHPYPKVGAVRPVVRGENALRVRGCQQSVRGRTEGEEARVALRVDLLSPMAGDRFPK
jgi:hypothetical protein